MIVKDLNGYLKKKLAGIEKAHTDALFEAVDHMTLWTPVKTGNARANWQAGNGEVSFSRVEWAGNDRSIDNSVVAGLPSSGYYFSMNNNLGEIEDSAGEVFNLVNTADYAVDLEHGSSQQSEGFAEAGFNKYKQLLDSGLKKIK